MGLSYSQKESILCHELAVPLILHISEKAVTHRVTNLCNREQPVHQIVDTHSVVCVGNPVNGVACLCCSLFTPEIASDAKLWLFFLRAQRPGIMQDMD
jgi:hypothetical protein